MTRSFRFLLIIKLEPIFSRRSMEVARHTFKLLYTTVSILILGKIYIKFWLIYNI